MFVAEYQILLEDHLIHSKEKEYTLVMRDMKTKRGASKRIRKAISPEDSVRCNLYSVTDIAKRETYRLEKVFVYMDYGSGMRQWV